VGKPVIDLQDVDHDRARAHHLACVQQTNVCGLVKDEALSDPNQAEDKFTVNREPFQMMQVVYYVPDHKQAEQE
jgi:hypothetical protein